MRNKESHQHQLIDTMIENRKRIKLTSLQARIDAELYDRIDQERRALNFTWREVLETLGQMFVDQCEQKRGKKRAG